MYSPTRDRLVREKERKKEKGNTRQKRTSIKKDETIDMIHVPIWQLGPAAPWPIPSVFPSFPKQSIPIPLPCIPSRKKHPNPHYLSRTKTPPVFASSKSSVIHWLQYNIGSSHL